VVWRTHAGEVVLVEELSVINLRRPGGGDGTEPAAHLSLHDVRYAPGTTPGSVALVREHGSGDEELAAGLILTDSLPAADYLVRRLRSVGWSGSRIEVAPRIASFSRTASIQNVTVRVTASDLELVAEWRGLFPQEWADGPSNNYPNQHAWAFVLEASDAGLSINGRRVVGETFPDERFRPMFGAPLSSAQIGLAEVSVDVGR
jgi:hypothetical protein